MNPGVIVKPLSARLASAARPGTSRRGRLVPTSTSQPRAGWPAPRCNASGLGKCRKTRRGHDVSVVHGDARRAALDARPRAADVRGAGREICSRADSAIPRSRKRLTCACRARAARANAPSGVDMAAYQAEFFPHYLRDASPPARSRTLRAHCTKLARSPRHMRRESRMRSLHAPTAGAFAQADAGDSSGAGAAALRASDFSRAGLRRARQARREDARPVILFPDTFNNFFEPEVAIAAVEVLERAGFRVTLPRARAVLRAAALRPGDARSRAKQSSAPTRSRFWRPAAGAAIPIVGLEPSCILTFRDELPKLFPGDARAAGDREAGDVVRRIHRARRPDFASGGDAGQRDGARPLPSEGDRRTGR